MFHFWNKITFVHPQWFWLLLILPLLWVLYYFFKAKRYPTITISTLQGLKQHQSKLAKFRFVLPLLRSLAILGLILAIARPKQISSNEKINKEVVDIVLCIDISTSMLARDFKPDRLEAVKKVAKEFIAKREGDRIGLVVFSGESFTQCPVTVDHEILYHLIDNIKLGVLEDGTAIGMGLATSVNRLKESNAKSKVIILLTDGVNNSGIIDPITATNLAATMNVKVYTIGAGTNGQAYSPIGIKPDGTYVFGMAEVKIDEELLRTISKNTNGKYYRATNTNQLRAIYNEIDKLEKTKIDVMKTQKQEEAFFPFILFSIACLLLLLLLRSFVFNSLP